MQKQSAWWRQPHEKEETRGIMKKIKSHIESMEL